MRNILSWIYKKGLNINDSISYLYMLIAATIINITAHTKFDFDIVDGRFQFNFVYRNLAHERDWIQYMTNLIHDTIIIVVIFGLVCAGIRYFKGRKSV